MFWFRRGRPAFKPAFLMGVACAVLVLLLATLGRPARAEGEGQSQATSKAASTPATAPASAAAPPAFHLEVHAPEPLRDTLLRHLELQQYRGLQDLDRDELDRLLVSAQDNARNLLATQGYFAAEVKISVQEPAASPTAGGPPASDAPAAQHTPWEVLIEVTPGEPVRVSAFQLQLSGDVAHNPELEAVQRSLTDTWGLRPGSIFTQAGWDSAKTEALRRLTATRYPTGHLVDSQARIDPDTQQAELSLTLDSGPDFRFGQVLVEGTQHHSAELVRRLAQIPTGSTYTQADLLKAQQRVADSGYFDSVFMSLDTSGDPQAAPVRVQVREAKLHKLVLGVGASTDSGARLSAEFTERKLPWLDWKALSKLSLDRDTKTLSSELTSQPDKDNWRWVTSGQVQRQTGSTAPVNSLTLRTGRAKTDEHYDRNFYLQYDHTLTQSSPAESASSVSANYAWTQRNFNNIPFPTRGYGLAVEVGPGLTLGSQRSPFLRSRARVLGFIPINESAYPSAAQAPRLAWRAEGGAVGARSSVVLPSTQLFLTGGDTTVRGYGYREIGVVQADGSLEPGRYLAVGSLEWQKPIVRNGRASEFESTVFIDAGAVADQASKLRAKVGVGVGARWRSPVGPLEVDLAWGAATRRLRLHLAVGFSF